MNDKVKRNKITTAVLLLAILAVAALMLARHGSAGKPVAGGGRPALTVTTTELRTEKWDHKLLATGSILPWQEAVITAQVQGLRIAEVKVGLGDHVRQGQVLATLDNRVGAMARRIAQGRIVAPDSGVISGAEATVGSMPRPGVELFRLIRKGRLEWHAELTADELMMVHRGMAATIHLSEGRVIRGRVRAISPSVDPKTRYGLALVTIPNSRGIIAGAFARGTFDLSGGRQPVQTLPETAVLQRGSHTFVLVVGADDHVHERTVVPGLHQGDRVQIRQGLKPHERVVESGGAFLTEGDVVQIVKH